MKKLVIASAIAMTMTAGSAMASQGDVQFFGNVTAETCDLVPEIGGAVNNMIQLGTVKVGAEGNDIEFSLKKAPGANCTAAAAKDATITWMGNLGTDGIMKQGGLAEGAYVVLTAKNSKTADTAITSTQSSVEFDKAELDKAGYKFTAKLDAQKATTPGDFQSSAAYAVTYK